jgi:hypothetical protein
MMVVRRVEMLHASAGFAVRDYVSSEGDPYELDARALAQRLGRGKHPARGRGVAEEGSARSCSGFMTTTAAARTSTVGVCS